VGFGDFPMGFGNQGFLAGMRAGGEPDGTAGQDFRQTVQFGLVHWQRRGCEFQVSGAFDIRRTQRLQAFRVLVAASLDGLEAA
jgi:hypothetical protein